MVCALDSGDDGGESQNIKSFKTMEISCFLPFPAILREELSFVLARFLHTDLYCPQGCGVGGAQLSSLLPTHSPTAYEVSATNPAKTSIFSLRLTPVTSLHGECVYFLNLSLQILRVLSLKSRLKSFPRSGFCPWVRCQESRAGSGAS